MSGQECLWILQESEFEADRVSGLRDPTMQAAEMRARRCFFVARSYLSDRKPGEAFALFGKAQERVAEAVTQHGECASPDATAIKVAQLGCLSSRQGRVFLTTKAGPPRGGGGRPYNAKGKCY